MDEAGIQKLRHLVWKYESNWRSIWLQNRSLLQDSALSRDAQFFRCGFHIQVNFSEFIVLEFYQVFDNFSFIIFPQILYDGFQAESANITAGQSLPTFEFVDILTADVSQKLRNFQCGLAIWFTDRWQICSEFNEKWPESVSDLDLGYFQYLTWICICIWVKT